MKYKAVTKEINDRLLFTADMVIDEFSLISGIDASKLKQNDTVKLLNLHGALKRRVFGQDAVLDHVDRAVKVWRRGRRTDRPLPFLLCGASGVGKTEVSKGLAEALYDTDKALNRYDMGEFMEKNDVTKLIGAPPGYDGFAAGGGDDQLRAGQSLPGHAVGRDREGSPRHLQYLPQYPRRWTPAITWAARSSLATW